MLFLELLQDVHLLLLVRARQTLLLLALIKHHLLDHASGFAVEIRQLRGVRLDLGHVNGRCGSNNMPPPFHLVGLVEMYFDRLGAISVGGQGPC